MRRGGRAPPGAVGGQPPTSAPAPVSLPQLLLSLYFLNIQSLQSPTKRTELQNHLDAHTPDILAITETWLDDSAPAITIPNYTQLSRRDRPGFTPTTTNRTNHGGIIVYTRNNTVSANALHTSPTAERLWFTVHTTTGPLLFGLFYRPQTDTLTDFDTLDNELTELTLNHTGTFLFGDFNVHEARWLRHSNTHTTPLGRRLHEISQSFNLTQTVHEPTRDNYLLDLLLTDHPNSTKTRVLTPIADHCPVLAKLTFAPIHETPHSRAVWDFRNADWEQLDRAFLTTNWTNLLSTRNADDATQALADHITSTAKKFIPTRTLHGTTSTHPWLDDDCRNAIHAKEQAYGTPHFKTATEKCNATLTRAHKLYKEKLRNKLRTLPKSSKQWWSINRELLNNATTRSTIPALLDEHGTWTHDATEKANLFAKTFKENFNNESAPAPRTPPNTEPTMEY